jgi:hypothetical protein
MKDNGRVSSEKICVLCKDKTHLFNYCDYHFCNHQNFGYACVWCIEKIVASGFIFRSYCSEECSGESKFDYFITLGEYMYIKPSSLDAFPVDSLRLLEAVYGSM